MKLRKTVQTTLIALAMVGIAHAKVDRVLHEPVPESAYAQAAKSRSTSNAAMNAAGSRAGTASAGTPSAAGAPSEGAAPTPGSESQFSIDRDTRRPNVLPYGDPFEPSVAPFKRVNAYDHVSVDYTLFEGSGDQTLTPSAAAPHETVFSASLAVDGARLPTPGPNARLVSIEAVDKAGKPVAVSVHTDSAENWSLQHASGGALTVKMRVAVSTDSFGGDFGDPSWDSLGKIAPLPAHIERSARTVAKHIGVSRAEPVRDVVQKLVGYFRAFQESNEPPPASDDIYLDLSLSQKGVCRHRAFSFLVTALGLGIPTRLITNEAHAWVEVYNGAQWKRIDLGGAGGALEASVRPPVATPPDPFAWPEGAARGSDLAAKATPSANGAPAEGASNDARGGDTANGVSNGATSAATTAATGTSATPEVDGVLAKAGVVEAYADTSAKRGGMLAVRGRVSREGRACPGAAVRVVLHDQRGKSANVSVGVLAAHEDGAFEGTVFIPRELPPGDYVILTEGACR